MTISDRADRYVSELNQAQMVNRSVIRQAYIDGLTEQITSLNKCVMTEEQFKKIVSAVVKWNTDPNYLNSNLRSKLESILNESPSFNPCLWPDWKVNEAEAIFDEILKAHNEHTTVYFINHNLFKRIENLLKPLPTKPLTELEKAEAWLLKYMDENNMENPQMLEEVPKVLVAFKKECLKTTHGS